jgi:hypothetical protein
MPEYELLCLADLAGMTQEELRDHVRSSYETNDDLENIVFLIAYESVGSWGCDSSSFFLMYKKDDGNLYENRGSHCSCYGFEGQWEPEETSVDYLESANFDFWPGGYDYQSDANRTAVMRYINNINFR